MRGPIARPIGLLVAVLFFISHQMSRLGSEVRCGNMSAAKNYECWETFTRLPAASHIPVEFVEFIIAFLVTRSVIIRVPNGLTTQAQPSNLDIVLYLCFVCGGRLFSCYLFNLVYEFLVKNSTTELTEDWITIRYNACSRNIENKSFNGLGYHLQWRFIDTRFGLNRNKYDTLASNDRH